MQKESYVTLCMCRLTLVWILAKLLQSYWNADSSSLTALDLISCRLVSLLSRFDSLCPSSLANCFLELLLSHSLTGVPFLLPVTPRSKVQDPLSGFAPKQTKESSAWQTPYIVLHKYLDLATELKKLWNEVDSDINCN